MHNGEVNPNRDAVIDCPAERMLAERQDADGSSIIDKKVTMLIAAGAAMAGNCEPCLNKAVPELVEAGVSWADIRRAVEIGQFVKDKPAALMKEAADLLTGTQLAGQSASDASAASRTDAPAATAVTREPAVACCGG